MVWWAQGVGIGRGVSLGGFGDWGVLGDGLECGARLVASCLGVYYLGMGVGFAFHEVRSGVDGLLGAIRDAEEWRCWGYLIYWFEVMNLERVMSLERVMV